ncbi:MAG: hypothetical protein R3C03_14450 [Pirellulaceae bacterium]
MSCERKNVPAESGLGVVEPEAHISKWTGWTFLGRPDPDTCSVDSQCQWGGNNSRTQGFTTLSSSRHSLR